MAFNSLVGNLPYSLILQFFIDLNYEEVAKEGYEAIKDKLKIYLAETLKSHYNYIKETPVAIQFHYQLSEGVGLDVDLLLSPYWDTEDQFFSDLMKICPPSKRLM